MPLFRLCFVEEPGFVARLRARTLALPKQKIDYFRLKDQNPNILLNKSKLFMGTFMLLTLTILVFTAVTIGGIWLMYKLLTNFQPSSNKIRQDLQAMKEEISIWISDLVPWKSDELELLSLNQANKVVKKGITTNAKGVITSIYHEPMIAWAYKRYFAGSNNAVLYARSSHHEFIYRIKKDSVQLHIDNQPIGEIRKDGKLYSIRTNRLLAQIHSKPVDGLLPIVVGDRELASLSNQTESLGTSTRAFQLLSEDLDREEEALLLSMSILELVQREVPTS